MAKVNDLAEALQDPSISERRMIEELEHATLGPVKIIGDPILFGSAPRPPHKAPPVLGQHTRSVLREQGLADGENEALAAGGVVKLWDRPKS